MSHQDGLDAGLNHIWPAYTQSQPAPTPVGVKQIEGCTFELADGRKLVDGGAIRRNWLHGYNHPRLQAALTRQLEALPHFASSGFAHEAAYALAARIAEIAPGDLTRSLFCETGGIAVEVAMKIAVQHWLNTTSAVRPKFVAFKGGDHGETFGTMSIHDPEDRLHAHFGHALPRNFILDLPEEEETTFILNDILAERTDIAAVVVEPLIQGAGGMRMHDAAVLKRIKDACEDHNVLLIFDESFTGLGRTGEMFAADKAGLAPDMMIIGEALTGGITPLAATVVSDKVYDAFRSDDPDKALMHATAFTGHAPACAAALESLKLLEETDALGKVRAIEAQLKTSLEPLRALEAVADVRMLGVVAAVEMSRKFDAETLRARCMEKGAFIQTLDRVLYLAPSYMMSQSELNVLTGAIRDVAEELG